MTRTALNLDGPNLREIANAVLADLLPPRLKRLWMARMGRMVIAQAKKNVAEQKTVDGTAMTSRKRPPAPTRPVYHRDKSVTRKKTHQKMLVDLVKSKFLRVDVSTEDKAVVGFTGGAGTVAFRHQHGIAEKVVREQVGSLFTVEEMTPGSKESYNPVSKKAAIELIKCGVGLSVIEIQRGWTAFQAAVYLGKMKTSWDVTTPARPFLGIDDEQNLAMGDPRMNGMYDPVKANSHAALLK